MNALKCTAAALTLLTGSAMAQQPGVSGGRGNVIQRGTPTQIIPGDPTSLSVEFPGGTLEQFVQALRSGTKDPVNISLQGDAAKLRIDPLMLREVSPEAALRAALGTRANGQSIDPDGTVMGTQLELIQPSDGRPVLVVTTRPMNSFTRGGPDAAVEVMSIRSIVKADGDKNGSGLSAQVVLSAIDSGLKLTETDQARKPQIDYHKDSGLLLVRGAPGDVGLVRDIVRRMMDDQQRLTIESRERLKDEINRKAALQRAELLLQVSENKANETHRRLDETQKLVDAGSASTRDLSDARMANIQAETEVRMSQVEISRLKEEMAAGVNASPRASNEDDEVAQLRGELAKALARIKELEDQAGGGKKVAAPPLPAAKGR